MASIWSLNGFDIYVDQFQEAAPGQSAELNPIDSSESIFHILFEPTVTYQLSGTVIGEANMNGIKATRNTIVSLISDFEPGGIDVFVQDVTINRIIAFGQTVDQLQAIDAPIFKINLTVRPD